MNFVDLDRMFAPLNKGEEATLEWGITAGRKYGGWLNWSELLDRQRVVLLAEALSGKTQELTFQTKWLIGEGRHSYFVRIEELADSGFRSSLDELRTADFDRWRTTPHAQAWFFLDSVDEARLNRKSFGVALRRFANELGRENLNRVHVVVTCRASDWHGKADRELIKDVLPSVGTTQSEPLVDADEALLAPIFNPPETTNRVFPIPHETQPIDLLVVQLVPLAYEQKNQFARAAGVVESEEFLRAVDRCGLIGMTERPGDLIDLIGYWKEHRAFGSLREMTDEGIERKLSEEDSHRSDADQITPQQAREGAERLAAALVLGKCFSLRAPGQEPDADLAHGALEPLKILPDWSPAQVNALMRRGLFAPATYGRVRFHHRSTQEFLAASWLSRLLAANCSLEEVRRLLFVELYGVETVRPALRAVAAWLSLSHPSILSEVTRREPVCLIAHGDPKSLPIKAREKLLTAYADLDAKGDLNPEMLDYRAVWMFSDPELSTAIRHSWMVNERRDFRIQLLRFIEEAPIRDCVDLAREVALDTDQDETCRLIATRALVACGDTAGLKQLAQNVRGAPDKLSARLAPELAILLYPKWLNTVDLLDLIGRSQQARRFQTEGFAQHLCAPYRAAPDRHSVQQLAFGVGDLYLSSWHEDDPNPYEEVAKGLAALALSELRARRKGDSLQIGMLRLLMAAERAAEDHENEEALLSVSSLVQDDACVNRALMWAEAETDRYGKLREKPPTHVWQIGPGSGRPLWGIGTADVEWLIEDSTTRPHLHQRRVAFSALYNALSRADLLAAKREQIEQIADSDPALRNDLAQWEAPPPPDPYAVQREENKRKREKQQTQAKQSWKSFRDELSKKPQVLDAVENLQSWKAGLFRLHHLTRWLKAKVRDDACKAARSWRNLGPVFGDAIAKHYCDGMRLAWRHIKAERPIYKGSSTYTTKHVSTLALNGLGIDSAEEPEWAKKLAINEARLAAKHACYAGDSSADWFQALVNERSADVIDIVRQSAAFEYASEGVRAELLIRSENDQTSARPIVAACVFRLLQKAEPVDDATLDRVLQILKVSRAELPRDRLRQIVQRRIEEHRQTGNEKRVLSYFALFLLLVPDEAGHQLCDLLAFAPGESEAAWRTRIRQWFVYLFGNRHRDGSMALTEMSVPTLVKLTKILYRTDLPHSEGDEDDDSMSVRDEVGPARSMALNALLSRPGADGFLALHELAADPAFSGDSLRVRELAHSKAEADGDLIAWNEREVLAFERAGTGPAKTGADLLRLVMALLSDISASFKQADASSRSVLQLAQDEDQVQTWLTERLNERSKDRFHAHREPKVADKNEPDVVVSSTSANVEIAIEVKNGNKKWTVTQLEDTLSGQLARDYLRTPKRRNGVLLISLHTDRTWKRSGEVWAFERLIDHLQTIAVGVTGNASGPVEVRVFGLDARAPIEGG